MVEIGSVLAELLLEESYSALEHTKQVGNWETISNARTIIMQVVHVKMEEMIVIQLENVIVMENFCSNKIANMQGKQFSTLQF